MQVSAFLAFFAGASTRFAADLKKFVPRQIDDMDAIDQLGRRVEAYGAIPTPTVFLSGANSPAHLGERTRAVAASMPHATITTMPGQGHGAHTQDPALVGRLIAEHAHTVGLGGTGS